MPHMFVRSRVVRDVVVIVTHTWMLFNHWPLTPPPHTHTHTQHPAPRWKAGPCPLWTACPRTSRFRPHSMTPPQSRKKHWSSTKSSTNQKRSRWHHSRYPPIEAAPLSEWNVYSSAWHKLYMWNRRFLCGIENIYKISCFFFVSSVKLNMQNIFCHPMWLLIHFYILNSLSVDLNLTQNLLVNIFSISSNQYIYSLE